jgi:hopanoid biosynthesis associated protein HpnK
VRRLILNADDLGLTPGVNRAIAEGFDAGILTSATLMAGAPAFDEAVKLAAARPGLGVGCHVVLVDGRPLSGSPRTLVAPGATSFRSGIAEFAWQAIRSRFDAEEIAAEALAQFRKVRQAGIALTHFDSHKHTHMFPQVLRPLLQAAKECGIRALRNPFAPIRAIALSSIARRPRLWVRYGEVRLLRGFASRFERAVRDAGLKTTQGTFGVIATGALDAGLFQEVLRCIPEGDWEFVFHPGYADADLARAGTRLRTSRETELRLLTSPDSRRLLDDLGIARITFADL